MDKQQIEKLFESFEEIRNSLVYAQEEDERRYRAATGKSNREYVYAFTDGVEAMLEAVEAAIREEAGTNGEE